MDFSPFHTETTGFVKYGTEHFLSVFAVVVFGVWFLYMGKYKWNEKQKWNYPIYLASFLYFLQLFKLFFRLYLGTMDLKEDLPLQLCNIIPLLLIIGLKYRSKLLMSVIFFWIMAGTIQANFTPTLNNVFPHYEAIRYWAIHTGLPILAIYSFYVLGFRYKFVDVFKSALGLNVLASIIYIVNTVLGANYLYLNAKPPPGTLYDLLGPWPWYILSIEFALIVFFSLVLIPFLIYEKNYDDVKVS